MLLLQSCDAKLRKLFDLATFIPEKLMIKDIFKDEICRVLGLTPTEEQAAAIDVFSSFATCPDSRSVMILSGSAGTGKTSLAGAIVRAMENMRQKVVLMAPTGRAAKVFSLNAGSEAGTIHRRIYRQKTYAGEDTAFSLNFNKHRDTLFIVDEASMITSGNGAASIFGSGSLLDDLMQYVYGGERCRLMLTGDKAQLPPVGETESPALSPQVIGGYGVKVFTADLNEVLRQGAGSGILWNATAIRRMITHDEVTQMPRITLSGFPDIRLVPGNELTDELGSSYSSVGTDETMVVTRSNKRANIHNNGIRRMILWREEPLESGDLLMVVKNNYHWTATEDGGSDERQPMAFLANGDRMVVRRVRNTRVLHDFTFADAQLVFPDYGDHEVEATVLLETLQAESPALTRDQRERLFNAVMEDYADIPRKSERLKKVREDRFYNALQIKYAYAVTCHKAQGGQWAHVYIDQGYMTSDMLSPDYIHWLYTAFTRATERLFLINWPQEQVMEE